MSQVTQKVEMHPLGGLVRLTLDFCAPLGYNLAQMCGCDAVVAYLLPKQTVVGSNPITRSIQKRPPTILR
jgi:hypothetical protein